MPSIEVMMINQSCFASHSSNIIIHGFGRFYACFSTINSDLCCTVFTLSDSNPTSQSIALLSESWDFVGSRASLARTYIWLQYLITMYIIWLNATVHLNPVRQVLLDSGLYVTTNLQFIYHLFEFYIVYNISIFFKYAYIYFSSFLSLVLRYYFVPWEAWLLWTVIWIAPRCS